MLLKLPYDISRFICDNFLDIKSKYKLFISNNIYSLPIEFNYINKCDYYYNIIFVFLFFYFLFLCFLFLFLCVFYLGSTFILCQRGVLVS